MHLYLESYEQKEKADGEATFSTDEVSHWTSVHSAYYNTNPIKRLLFV